MATLKITYTRPFENVNYLPSVPVSGVENDEFKLRFSAIPVISVEPGPNEDYLRRIVTREGPRELLEEFIALRTSSDPSSPFKELIDYDALNNITLTYTIED